VVADCALELVECIGQFDPGLSSQYLALYQVFLLLSRFIGFITEASFFPGLFVCMIVCKGIMQKVMHKLSRSFGKGYCLGQEKFILWKMIWF